jgi:hypothetical protein
LWSASEHHYAHHHCGRVDSLPRPACVPPVSLNIVEMRPFGNPHLPRSLALSLARSRNACERSGCPQRHLCVSLRRQPPSTTFDTRTSATVIDRTLKTLGWSAIWSTRDATAGLAVVELKFAVEICLFKSRIPPKTRWLSLSIHSRCIAAAEKRSPIAVSLTKVIDATFHRLLFARSETILLGQAAADCAKVNVKQLSETGITSRYYIRAEIRRLRETNDADDARSANLSLERSVSSPRDVVNKDLVELIHRA